MAVKNGANYIHQSINSILNQTYQNFELIVINDGSIDETIPIVSNFNDPRIILISQENRGVAISANRGLALTRGKYIARQDHDDFSDIHRLKKQVDFLNKNEEVGLVGARAAIWVGDKPTERVHAHPTNSEILAFDLIFNNPFVHSSCMFRKEVLNKVGFYSPSPAVVPLDDYHFISRVSHVFKVANIEDTLVVYRESEESLTSAFRIEARSNDFNVKLAAISEANIRFWCGNRWSFYDYKKFSEILHLSKIGNSRDVNFFSMREMIKYAAERINLKYGGKDLTSRIFLHVDNLEFRWYRAPALAPVEKIFFHRAITFSEEFIYRLKNWITVQLAIIKNWILVKINSIKRRCNKID
jgi:glycosyltransferase involved in cell wall biosynthesis